MKIEGEGKLIRIFIGENDKIGHRPLYEAITLKAREMGMAGATVLRGIAGYGARSRIHTAKILRLSEDLPLIVELVDTVEKIDSFIKVVDEMFEQSGCGGLITEERAGIIRYTEGK